MLNKTFGKQIRTTQSEVGLGINIYLPSCIIAHTAFEVIVCCQCGMNASRKKKTTKAGVAKAVGIDPWGSI